MVLEVETYMLAGAHSEAQALAGALAGDAGQTQRKRGLAALPIRRSVSSPYQAHLIQAEA